MSNYIIKMDSARCIGCRACEVHCQAKNKTPRVTKLGRLLTTPPRLEAGRLQFPAGFLTCFHCEEPWCVAACPVGALVKRTEDGLVFVEKSLCVGCRACIDACPWGIPQWDETTGKAVKCDYCRDRIDEEMAPACVTGCTSHALTFGKSNEGSRRSRTAFAKALLTQNQRPMKD